MLGQINPKKLWVLTNLFPRWMFTEAFHSAVGNIWIKAQLHNHKLLKAQSHLLHGGYKAAKRTQIQLWPLGHINGLCWFSKKKERTTLNPITLTKMVCWIDNVGKMLHSLSLSEKDTLTYCVHSLLVLNLFAQIGKCKGHTSKSLWVSGLYMYCIDINVVRVSSFSKERRTQWNFLWRFVISSMLISWLTVMYSTVLSHSYQTCVNSTYSSIHMMTYRVWQT